MANIFNDIKGLKYNRPVQSVLTSGQNPVQKDPYSQWKKDPSSQNTKALLDYLKPTIDSALHSYVPGQEDQFRLKATSLAMQGLKRYDPQKSASPRTFVFNQLQRLNRVRRQRENPIHIPESQVYLKQTVSKKYAQLQESLGRDPSYQELSEYTKMSQKKLRDILQTGATVNDSSTLNQAGDSTFTSFADQDKDMYSYVYNSVSPVDQKIMEWSSGYGKQLSNNEIAKRLKLSPGAVSQRKAKIQQMLGQIRSYI